MTVKRIQGPPDPAVLLYDVLDAGEIRWSTRTLTAPPCPTDRDARDAWYDQTDADLKILMSEADAWLAEQGYPDWKSPHLYWDVP